MFSEMKCNAASERRVVPCRRICTNRRHNFRFDEYGYDRRIGIGRRSSDDRRAGIDRRVSNNDLSANRVNRRWERYKYLL